jgi:DNA recombination protein RmuC
MNIVRNSKLSFMENSYSILGRKGMSTILISLAVALLIAGAAISAFFLIKRRQAADFSSLRFLFEFFEKNQEKTERALREDIAQNRLEASRQAQQTREELSNSLKGFGDSLQKQMTDFTAMQKGQMDSFSRQLSTLTESNENKLELLRETVEQKLKNIQEDNTLKLEQMRNTVDEKLQGTLEKRLGDSFRQVSERLEQVHQGLGDMRSLAAGVGDLKKVLTNVKTRGGWGEVQLGMLLEEMLAPEQFARNVQTNENSRETVEYAVKLPGQGDGGNDSIWLPVDAKFPMEDYQRLVEAQENAAPDAIETATKMLEARIKSCAKDICVKYLNPPHTTDFAIMFLPTEGLYAEVVKRFLLVELIRRNFRVVIAGPSTFAALLNSFQMGFRTLAIQKRSGEIWSLLGAVKTEFGKFGATLESVKKKLVQASSTMDDAAKRSHAIERKLRDIQELPVEETKKLLPENIPEPD